MGITGLLPFLEKASTKCNISDFSGCAVAIDTYCWLHKGAFSCADKLVRGEKTDAHIKYCLKYVNMLLSHSIKPILVFDGRHLPAKAMTEAKRRESRNTAKKRAAELLRLGLTDEARNYMRRCVDITHEMALVLIKECRAMNVDCIVAPYEADAQMAYLNKINIAQVVITEDSDLVLFGCTKIFYKMDLNGHGVLVESSKLPLVMKCPLERFNFNKFRQMCIMSGCDYLASLPGIGLAKARQFINATQDPKISNALRRVPSFFKKNSMTVSDEYCDGFLKAEATFKHQLVFDPLKRKLAPLTSLEDEGTDPEDCTNAGALLDPDIAFQLALGNLDPFSLKKMDDWHPDNQQKKLAGGKTNGWKQCSIAPHKSMWSEDYLDHVQKTDSKRKSVQKCVSAFSMPTTRKLISKMVMTRSEEKQDEGLTIDDLSSMYCQPPPSKKKKVVIVEETQDFNCTEIFETKNPFAVHPSTNVQNNVDDVVEFSKDTTTVNNSKDDNFRSDSNLSPILENKNRNYHKLMKNSSFSKFNKLSKFQRTVLDESNPVQSRFFGSDNRESVNTDDLEKDYLAIKEESGLNVSGIAGLKMMDDSDDAIKVDADSGKESVFDVLVDETNSLNNSGVLNKRLSLNSFGSSGYLSNSISNSALDDCTSAISSENSSHKKNPFKKTVSETISYSESFHNENTYPLEDIVTPVASQVSFSDDDDVIEIHQSLETNSASTNRPSIHPIAKNKSNIDIKKQNKLCRRPGLHKKTSNSSIPGVQQSLLTTFGFHKKSQLKH